LEPQEALPDHLAHKPFFALPYQNLDGIYAANTDLKYLSIGLAQYDNDVVSVKTMRHTGGKWSRQAEELPLHRCVDLTLFLVKSVFDVLKSDDFKEKGAVNFDKGTFQHQSSDITLIQEQRSYGECAAYHNFLKENGGMLKERLNALFDVLETLKNENKF
jgi:hypothetical protein